MLVVLLWRVLLYYEASKNEKQPFSSCASSTARVCMDVLCTLAVAVSNCTVTDFLSFAASASASASASMSFFLLVQII